MDNQEEINYEAEIDQSYLDLNLEINVLPYQFEPLPRARDQPQGHGLLETSSSEESEGEKHVNEDRIVNTNW